jgi:hypothetical protein
MSNTKKVVKISESELVDMIDNLVTEVLAQKKQEWIQEQAKNGNKTPLLEQQLADLSKKVESLLETKK